MLTQADSLEVSAVLLGGPDLLHLSVDWELLDAALVQQAICTCTGHSCAGTKQ